MCGKDNDDEWMKSYRKSQESNQHKLPTQLGNLASDNVNGVRSAWAKG